MGNRPLFAVEEGAIPCAGLHFVPKAFGGKVRAFFDSGDQSNAQAVELRNGPHLAGCLPHRHAIPRQSGRALSSQLPWSSVPLHRRWMSDVVHFGKKSHVVAGNWTINVSPVAVARKLRRPPIGWGAIWVKAVALACRKWPELRTAYLPFPWPRLYLHPHAVATIVVERGWKGRPAVFFDQIKRPELLSLVEIDAILRGLKRRPVESVGGYRRLIRFSRLPSIVRRPVWSFALRWSGRLRSEYFGTYSVHSFPVRRAQVMQSTTPISFSLIYGLLSPDGDMLVQLLMDHRIVDGLTSHRIMLAIEAAMKEEIVAELTAAARSHREGASFCG